MKIIDDFFKFFDNVKNLDLSLTKVTQPNLKYFLRNFFEDSKVSYLLKDGKTQFTISAEKEYMSRDIDYILDGKIVILDSVKIQNKEIYLELVPIINELKQKYISFNNYENFKENNMYSNTRKLGEIFFKNDLEDTLKKHKIEYELKEEEKHYFIKENSKRIWGDKKQSWKVWNEKHYISEEVAKEVERSRRLGAGSSYKDEYIEEYDVNLNNIKIKKENFKTFKLNYGIVITQGDSETFNDYKELNVNNIKIDLDVLNINDNDYKNIENIQNVLVNVYNCIKSDNNMNVKINPKQVFVNSYDNCGSIFE